MEYKIFTPSQSIAKVFLREKPLAEEIEGFRAAIQELFIRINPQEREEFNKNLVTDFFNKSLYSDTKYMVNTYHDTDLAIYAEMETPDEHPVVLFEFKGPDRPDMVTKENLKKKAFYQLVLYYIREEVRNHNTDIKHLIITNCWEYFIFEKKLFYKLFARDKHFAQQVINADTGDDNTDYIYNEIIKSKVESVEEQLQFGYVDLRAFRSKIGDKSIINSKSFIAIYKLFSPTHLLKLPYYSDHNKLNKNFYDELLYIMGIEEVVDNGVHKIKRLKNGRQPYSLVEQAFLRLEEYPGMTKEESRFEMALGLVLTWINRILFLKLLESQLIRFNPKENVRFLDISHVRDYDVLHDLFMQVLAKPFELRSEEMKRDFPEVPYLNSSLFELSDNERGFFPISGIRMGNIEVYTRTVLKDERGRRVSGSKSTLDYLFLFLNAYDFGSESTPNDDSTRTEGKTLINASVLGLIFEKINGYKDGSFFTPGYITEYICNMAIRKAVVDKFNETKKWDCADFEELKEKIDYGKREVRKEANEIINSLRICDPAVGSGHFLVSALNEIIAIKSELGVLQDRQQEPKRILDYEVNVEYDELVVANEDGELFNYIPSEPAKQRVQETLFEEKRTIIENCLFGVDLNPKSVEICRLRLWIELLKNAYYYRTETGARVLQTLPNIDINIKNGDSLASACPVCIGRKIMESAGLQKLVREYKETIREYKNCHSKTVKNELKETVKKIKNNLTQATQLDLFTQNNSVDVSEVLKNRLEWMIEFPEVLDENGSFLGFDVIIGNPPYISLEILNKEKLVYGRMNRLDEANFQTKTYLTLETRGDIYSLFVERGMHLLRKGGVLSYIMPNKWQKVMYGKPLRELFLKTNLTHLIDFGDNQIFEDATTYTCIIQMTKEKSKGKLFVSTIEQIDKEMLPENIEEKREEFDKAKMNNGIWVISSHRHFETVERLKTEMIPLGEFINEESYYGIKTALSGAFLISIEKAKELMVQDIRSKEVLRPFLQGRGLVAYGKANAGSYLIYTPKGFTLNGLGIEISDEDRRNRQRRAEIMPSEEEAWQWFSTEYPAVAEWLLPFKARAKARSDKGDYWWELRACDYYNKFAEPKLFYQVFQTKPCFVYDESSTFCNNSMYFMTVPNKALMALLCSSVGWWLISEFCPRIQNGAQLIWDNFRQIPVPRELPETLSEYADKMMAARNDEEEFQKFSKEVDEIVEGIYKVEYVGINKNMVDYN